MLKNAYFLAKIGADTAENEQHFAEILPIGRRVADWWDCGPAGGGPRRADQAARGARRGRRGRERSCGERVNTYVFSNPELERSFSDV